MLLKGGDLVQESLELARVLRETPDLLPWVVFACFMLMIVSQRKRIFAYFDARIDYWKGKRESDAILSELVRNNTAALNNNTAALESTKIDRGQTRLKLDHHEQSSKERFDAIHNDISHIQEVVNKIDATVSNNSKQIGIIEDRTSN